MLIQTGAQLPKIYPRNLMISWSERRAMPNGGRWECLRTRRSETASAIREQAQTVSVCARTNGMITMCLAEMHN